MRTIERNRNECGIDEIKTEEAIVNQDSWMIMEKFDFVRTDKTKFGVDTYLDEQQYYLAKKMYFENKKIINGKALKLII